MRRIIITLGTMVALKAVGAAELPHYFKEVKGTLVTSLTERADFNFIAGEVGDCERREAPNMVLYKCPLAKANVSVRDSRGLERAYKFNSLAVILQTTKEGDLHRQYIFRGDYAEVGTNPLDGKSELILNHYRSNEKNFDGHLAIAVGRNEVKAVVRADQVQ